MAAIHHFVSTAEPGAVGTHTLHLRQLVRDRLGLASEIYAEHRRGPFTQHARPLDEYRGQAGDLLIYQMAIGSEVVDFVLAHSKEQRGRIVVNHHNLTPLRYLRPWDPAGAFGVQWGARQLHQLAPHTALGIADSEYNELDLRRAGYDSTAVAPVLFDQAELAAEPDDAALARMLAGQYGAAWLFVGRIAANKCQHQLVRALAVYRRLYDADARLYLVGGPSSGPYVTALRAYARDLGLERAVVLTGPTTAAQLATYYRHADVFVCLSEHEGFCVPLIEAMGFGVPVVAARSSVIPETAAGAGLILPAPRGQPPAIAVAAAVYRAVTDTAVRTALIAAGRARAEQFALARSLDRMQEALTPLLAAG